jgi:hypothetical protein
VFQELVARDHFLKALLRHEVVILPLDLVWTRLARGVRDGEAQARFALHERLDQAGFAGPGRRGNDI